MEEPRITGATVDDFKQLLGGERFEVDVKYLGKEYLERIPVLISTNEQLGIRLHQADHDALMSRIQMFTLDSQIESSTVVGTVQAANKRLCCCHWYKFIQRVLDTEHEAQPKSPSIDLDDSGPSTHLIWKPLSIDEIDQAFSDLERQATNDIDAMLN